MSIHTWAIFWRFWGWFLKKYSISNLCYINNWSQHQHRYTNLHGHIQIFFWLSKALKREKTAREFQTYTHSCLQLPDESEAFICIAICSVLYTYALRKGLQERETTSRYPPLSGFSYQCNRMSLKVTDEEETGL